MTRTNLDKLDELILDTIQENFPINARPYDVIAENINQQFGLKLTGQAVLERIAYLKNQGFIRRLGAIFNPGPLGYRSTLCAARVPTGKIETFASLVNIYPQVTHNYIRNSDPNIWFTFCFQKNEELSIFLEDLKKNSGVKEIFELSALKVFKIRAVFDMN